MTENSQEYIELPSRERVSFSYVARMTGDGELTLKTFKSLPFYPNLDESEKKRVEAILSK